MKFVKLIIDNEASCIFLIRPLDASSRSIGFFVGGDKFYHLFPLGLETLLPFGIRTLAARSSQPGAVSAIRSFAAETTKAAAKLDEDPRDHQGDEGVARRDQVPRLLHLSQRSRDVDLRVDIRAVRIAGLVELVDVALGRVNDLAVEGKVNDGEYDRCDAHQTLQDERQIDDFGMPRDAAAETRAKAAET